MSLNQVITSISSFILPITYTITIIYVLMILLSKSNIKAPFIKSDIEKGIIRFILIMTSISILAFIVAYNKGKINILVSIGIITLSYILSKLLYKNKFFSISNIMILSSIFLSVILNNMFAHPEAFSIEKSGNFDVVRLILLQLIAIMLGFIISTNIVYKRYQRTGKVSKTKKHIFLNKTLSIFILNCSVLLLFTESIISLQASFIFSLIISYYTGKNLEKAYWTDYHNIISNIVFASIISLSSIFIGNILLTIISAFSLGIIFKVSFDNEKTITEALDYLKTGYKGI